MTKRAKRLFPIALSIIIAALYFGCSQPDDIITPVSLSKVNLDFQLLPTAPLGMAYEVWVTDNQDTISLGKFNYDPAIKRVLDANRQPRAERDTFELHDDLFDFEWMLVSVETEPDNDLSAPGPIMLQDRITDPGLNPIELRFPDSDSMWFSILDFFLVSVSDTNRYENNSSGLWFGNYAARRDTIRDVLEILSWRIDSTVSNNPDNPYTPTTETEGPSIAVIGYESISLETIEVQFGFEKETTVVLDTVPIRETRTDPPFLFTVPFFNLRFSPYDTVEYDRFGQQGEPFPDFTPYGWRLKGWIVSPHIEEAGASLGKMTEPAWNMRTTYDGLDGGLLTTGTFVAIDQPDDSAIYVKSDRIPSIPGDEFFRNLPNNAPGPIDLLPNQSGNSGTVFVTLEPENMPTDTTNFPLIVLAGNMPSARSQIEIVAAMGDSIPPYRFDMRNHTNTNDPFRGFPKITVSVRRF